VDDLNAKPCYANSTSNHSAHRSAAEAATATSSAYQSYTAGMHASMQHMMEDMHRDPPSGNEDIDFLVMMIPHHWGAVEMALLVLSAGKDPMTRALAEAMISDQNGEIEGMRGRLAALRSARLSGDSEYPHLDGNRGPS